MKRLALILLLMGSVACGSSPSTPTPTTNYQGQWSGFWARSSCTEQGVAVGICAQLGPSGSFQLTLTQTGSAVQGTLVLANFSTPVTGSVGTDGAITLTGQSNQSLGTLTISSWRSQLANSTMSGSFTHTIQVPPAAGSGAATLTGTFAGATKI